MNIIISCFTLALIGIIMYAYLNGNFNKKKLPCGYIIQQKLNQFRVVDSIGIFVATENKTRFDSIDEAIDAAIAHFNKYKTESYTKEEWRIVLRG